MPFYRPQGDRGGGGAVLFHIPKANEQTRVSVLSWTGNDIFVTFYNRHLAVKVTTLYNATLGSTCKPSATHRGGWTEDVLPLCNLDSEW